MTRVASFAERLQSIAAHAPTLPSADIAEPSHPQPSRAPPAAVKQIATAPAKRHHAEEDEDEGSWEGGGGWDPLKKIQDAAGEEGGGWGERCDTLVRKLWSYHQKFKSRVIQATFA